ncbi:MAG: PIG-L deacetylase family protein [Actinomycetota bacterium]
MEAELARRWAVLSTHLDDGVLSLGAAIAHATGRGIDVSLVTVLAGDPESSQPARRWDQRAGFRTAGEAAHARREEDRRACLILGATPIHLPFSDSQYGREATDQEVWQAVASAVGDADTILLPGFPLIHPDHAWVAKLMLTQRPLAARLGLYVEQPYASRRGVGPPEVPAAIRPLVEDSPSWAPIAVGPEHLEVKRRAVSAYGSQLRPLRRRQPMLLVRVSRYERHRGGEAVAWLSPRN